MKPEIVFLIVWAVGVALIWPPWILWSLRSRREAGFAAVPRAPEGALYAETGASGREHGKPLARASNCLIVAVTPDELIVTLKFPFLLMAPPSLGGFAHRVRLDDVSAAPHRGWTGGNVRVRIGRPAERAVLDLKLRDPDKFLAAVSVRG